MTGIILATQFGSKFILILMIGLSIWSISIMIDRIKALNKTDKAASFKSAEKLIKDQDWEGLKKWAENSSSGVRAGTIHTLIETKTKDIDKCEKSVRSYLSTERMKLEKGMTTLATLAANAAFIGLLGTVLGVIQAFSALGASQGAAASVMVGISEALIATAVGLFVAIPAGIAYNALSRKIKILLTDCESLMNLYLSRHS
ncbi:MAG: MotA/TolQ/ExbB proton channel family protein [Xanthomonadaceae bacterium]|nr:MotA/TolQ/ExbB proton channel family protein [Xanthomonadaceae bacterium]